MPNTWQNLKEETENVIFHLKIKSGKNAHTQEDEYQ